MVYLEESTHTYYNSENADITYTSITKLVEKYKIPFDKMYHANRIAERDNRDVEDILEEWHQKNKEANEYGTNLHKILENYLIEGPQYYIPKNDYEKTVIEEFEKLDVVKNEVKPEAVLHYEFNTFNGIAGTADIIEKAGNKYFNIWDFKTNKQFRYDSPFDNWLKFPVDFLPECEYSIYTLQLSIYAYLFELQTGRKANRIGAFYWDKQQQTFSFIPMMYMKDTVKNLIEHFKINYIKN